MYNDYEIMPTIFPAILCDWRNSRTACDLGNGNVVISYFDNKSSLKTFMNTFLMETNNSFYSEYINKRELFSVKLTSFFGLYLIGFVIFGVIALFFSKTVLPIGVTLGITSFFVLIWISFMFYLSKFFDKRKMVFTNLLKEYEIKCKEVTFAELDQFLELNAAMRVVNIIVSFILLAVSVCILFFIITLLNSAVLILGIIMFNITATGSLAVAYGIKYPLRLYRIINPVWKQ